MGARIEATDGRFPPFTVYGSAPARDLLRAAGRQRAGQVVRAARRPARRRRDDGPRADPQPRPHRADARRAPASTIHRNGPFVTVANSDELELEDIARPRRPVVGRVPGHRGRARARLAARRRAASASTGRAPASSGSSSGWAGSSSATSRTQPGDDIPPTEPVTDLDVTAGPLVGTVVERRRGAAGDRRAAARRAARLLRRGGDRRARRAGAARQGVRPHRHRRRGPARPRRRDRGDRRRLRGHRHRRPARRRRSTPTATTAWRCSARSPAWRRPRASRSSGWTPRP